MDKLLHDIKNCHLCANHLPLGPRPVVSLSSESKIIIIGQAPGLAVHNTGIAWNDKSGENLRTWMGISKADFYDSKKIGIMPMGFCYPGRGKSGDNPPRKECAPAWHELLLKEMKQVKLILLIGKYAQDYHLPTTNKQTLTKRVQNYKSYLPHYFVLPHPSPRNNIWQAKNKWFPKEVLPHLKETIAQVLK